MKRRAVVLIILAIGVAGLLWSLFKPQPSPAIPEIRVDHFHPLVGDAVRKAVSRVQKNPRSATAWGELGMLLIAHDLRAPARECLEHAAQLDPQDFRWPYFMGYSLEDHDFNGALAHYERAQKLRTDYVPLQLRIALILMHLGKWEQCRTILEESRRAVPGNPYLLAMQGRLAILQNDLSHADALLTKASQIPGWAPQSAFLELIKLASRRGDYALAYVYQRKLAQLPTVSKSEVPDPVLEEVRRFESLAKSQAEQADFALARGNLPAAIAGYEAFLQKRTDLPTPYVNLAQAYAMSGRYPEAIAKYLEALKLFGDVVAAHLGLAGTYELTKQPDLAIKHYRAALHVKANHQRAWFLLGLLFEQQERLEDAVGCYQRSVAADPSFAQAELAWGVALIKQHRDNQARSHIARAVALAPGDPVPLGYLQTIDKRLKAGAAKPDR